MTIDGRTIDHTTLEHLRRTAIRRVMEDGEKPSEVMRSMGLCRTSIYPWLRAYKKKGHKALHSRTAQGPVPKLSYKQVLAVRKWIVGKDPRQYGFEFGLWTRKIVSALIEKKFGVNLQLTAVGRLLAHLEITPQMPLRRAYERDPERVEQWIKKEFPSIGRRANKHGAKIFFLDEAGFRSDPNLGRTYGLKGKTPIVHTSGQRQSVNALSAVNSQGAFWYKTYTGKFNAALFMHFLKDFLRGRREPVFLIVDGHPSHKAKKIRDYIQSLKGRLELYFLPPYAPDLNPDEFVWSYMKTNGLHKKPLMKNESLKKRVEADLRFIKKNKKLVRSFFLAKTVVYAKD